MAAGLLLVLPAKIVTIDRDEVRKDVVPRAADRKDEVLIVGLLIAERMALARGAANNRLRRRRSPTSDRRSEKLHSCADEIFAI